MSVDAAPVSPSTVVVAVDVGKKCVALSVTDASRRRLFGPVEFAMTRPAVERVVARVRDVLPTAGVVKVGVEAAGHYHLPMIKCSAWPAGWEVPELNPAHVGEQRRVAGRRRVKTDAIDLEAITELVLAGPGRRVRALHGCRGGLDPVQHPRAWGFRPQLPFMINRRDRQPGAAVLADPIQVGIT